MTRHVVIGLVATPDGLAADFTRDRGAWSSPADEYRTIQPRHIPVDLNHDGNKVGEVIHLEQTPAGIWAVAQLDIGEPCVRVKIGRDVIELKGEATYFSATKSADLDDRDIELLSVAVVHRTARLGAGALRWYAGDLYERGSWVLDSFVRGLLDRATETSHTRHNGPHRIRRHQATPTYTRVAGDLWLDERGEPVPRNQGWTDSYGPLHIRPSKIIGVR